MRHLALLPLTTLLVAACSDSAGNASPSPLAPQSAVLERDFGDAGAGLSAAALSALAVPVAANCVIVKLRDSAGILRVAFKGSCKCEPNGNVAVGVTIWGGAAGNTITGRAVCKSPNGSVVTVAGPVSATDPGGGALGINGAFGKQVTGTPDCVFTGTSVVGPPSNRHVICIFA
jgi:hypothetical protein